MTTENCAENPCSTTSCDSFITLVENRSIIDCGHRLLTVPRERQSGSEVERCVYCDGACGAERCYCQRSFGFLSMRSADEENIVNEAFNQSDSNQTASPCAISCDVTAPADSETYETDASRATCDGSVGSVTSSTDSTTSRCPAGVRAEDDATECHLNRTTSDQLADVNVVAELGSADRNQNCEKLYNDPSEAIAGYDRRDLTAAATCDVVSPVSR